MRETIRLKWNWSGGSAKLGERRLFIVSVIMMASPGITLKEITITIRIEKHVCGAFAVHAISWFRRV